MLFKPQSHTITHPDGTTITLETGKLARLAHGSVLVTQGNAMLLATVAEDTQTQNQSFLPLSVDYQENYASAGKIPGGFLKREGRLTTHEILVSRLVDRAIRPCFPANYFNNGITSSMRLSAFYDTRNNRLFPSKGSFISASVEDATRLLGSTNEFYRYDLKHRYYFDLGYNIVIYWC